MLRIAIVDDDAQYRVELLRFLDRYCHQHNLAFQAKEYPDGDELLDRYAGNFDIIFLDVLMKYMDGIKTAEKIRSMDSEMVIIFVSSTPQYAMKGYLVDAFDYVLKPLVYSDFAARLDRALAKMRRRSQKFLSIPVKSGVQKIDEREIYYVEVCNHDLMFHTASGTFESKGTLAEMEQRLDSRSFLSGRKNGGGVYPRYSAQRCFCLPQAFCSQLAGAAPDGIGFRGGRANPAGNIPDSL